MFIFHLQKTPVEFFGVPLNDEILLQARASDVLGACRSFVTDDVYEGHFHRLTNGNETEKQVLKSFFEVLAGLESADQEECFEAIVNTLRRNIEGLTHVVERLQTGKKRSFCAVGPITSRCSGMSPAGPEGAAEIEPISAVQFCTKLITKGGNEESYNTLTKIFFSLQ